MEGRREDGGKKGRERRREGGREERVWGVRAERGTSAYEDAFNEQPSAHTKKSCQ